MSRAINEFQLAKKQFEEKLTSEEIEIVVNIRDRINLTGKNIGTWQIQELATVEERLARYTETLGEIYADHETRAEWMKAWIEEQIAKEFDSEKENLKQLKGKVTQSDIQRNLQSKYWEDTSTMILGKGLARKYKAIISAVDRVMLATTHRIRELERQHKESNI